MNEPPKRRFQFHLRTVFLVTTIAAVAFWVPFQGCSLVHQWVQWAKDHRWHFKDEDEENRKPSPEDEPVTVPPSRK